MDLNFVDPPIEAGMEPYEPTIRPEAAEQAMGQLADSVRKDDVSQEAWGPGQIEEMARAIERPDVAKVYSEGVPFIARFLTVELDTENDIAKGIGRIAPGDPPPRFGKKYARRLRSTGAVDRIGAVLEQLAFRGFGLNAAANAMSERPPSIDFGRSVEDWWGIFLRRMAPTYWETEIDPEKGMMAAMTFTICRPAIEDYVDLAREFRLARRVSLVGGARVMTYPAYFIALGVTLYGSRLDNV